MNWNRIFNIGAKVTLAQEIFHLKVCKTLYHVKQFFALHLENFTLINISIFFYTTSGCDGFDKYEVCSSIDVS